MARSWGMISSLLLILWLGTHCTEDESEPADPGGRGGSPGIGGQTPAAGSGGAAQGQGGASDGGRVVGEGGAKADAGASTDGARFGGANSGGAGGVAQAPECVLAGEAGAGMTCCWECPWGEPCRHLECGNGTVEEGCLIPFRCHQSSPAGGISGPYHYEQCDDGNQLDGDGCSRHCQLEYEVTCGNGRLDDHEDCDDGNREPNDGCDQRCRGGSYRYHCDVPGEPCVEDLCGDGRSGVGQCDDGNTESDDGCSDNCVVELGWACPPEGACEEAYCGNGSTDDYAAGDEDGFAGASSIDGELVRREGCDDGNRRSGDGCSAYCQIEEGWTCGLLGGPCKRPDCGDGDIFTPETCDDGNDQPGDGCDDRCQVEPGWVCMLPPALDQGAGGAPDARPPTQPSSCTRATCGDRGVSESEGENCDDGNRRSGDGCSDDCQLEGEPCTELEEE